MSSPSKSSTEPRRLEAPAGTGVSVGLFVATLVSVYLVYGYQWLGGDPFRDPETAAGAAKFSIALMAILGAHEMGHYLVARSHGIRLTLPYFIPFPAAFGTFGAIIRLRSLPPSRAAQVEMGAAGPLAGLAVALVVMALGLPGTVERAAPELAMAWPPPPLAPPEPGVLDAVLSSPPLSWLLPAVGGDSVPLMIMANPPAMDLLGTLILGAPPGRYAELDPLGMAGWVGCLLTAVNLVPIGQLDGGHVFGGLRPDLAPRVTRALIGLLLAGGLLWAGWAVWAVLLLVLRAWSNLPVPLDPPIGRRARGVALLALVAFGLTFMARPLEMEDFPLDDLVVKTPEGRRVTPEEIRAWRAGAAAREDAVAPGAARQ